jgi:hypothetical protein
MTKTAPLPAPAPCTVTASCEEGDHSYTWPCDLAVLDEAPANDAELLRRLAVTGGLITEIEEPW